MERLFLCVTVLCLSFFSFAEAKECIKCKTMAAWGLAAEPASLFNADNVARYEGDVVSVQEVEPKDGLVDGIYVLLKTPDGNTAVRLGPAWYLKKQGFEVQPRDKLEIMASKVTTESDKPALIATKAKNGNKTIALRSSAGAVVWNGLDR